jgi:AcrR family transcriptional regulator
VGEGYFWAMLDKQKSISSDAILQAATALVRRLGEGKTSMVDIGKALGVSHAALYRLYPSKSAIMDAIVREAMADEAELASKWLDREGPAGDRMLNMVLDIHHRKRSRFCGDREIHDLYRRIMVERQDMIRAYAERMTLLIETLISQAVERGEWRVSDVSVAAGVVRDGVTPFIHPQFVALAVDAGWPVEAQLRAMVTTLTKAFEAGVDYSPVPPRH